MICGKAGLKLAALRMKKNGRERIVIEWKNLGINLHDGAKTGSNAEIL